MKKVEEIFLRNGLSYYKKPPLPKMWIFGDGDVKPFFVPIIQKRYGGVIISGGFGLYIEEFENEWRRYYKSHVGEDIKIDVFPLILHMYNIDEFKDWPLFNKNLDSSDSGVAAQDWIKSIFKYMNEMPKFLGELEDSFCRGSILNVNVDKYFAHWVKVRYLSRWAKSFGLECIAQSTGLVKNGRFDPFEKLIPFI